MRRIIGSSSSGSIHQDNQQPRNHNSFSYGKNKSGTFTSNNNSSTRTASSTLCSKIEENNRGRNGFQFDKIFLWSDSTTVLSWIKNFKLKHKVYIGNRIAEIRDLTSIYQWNYVNTKDNPADQGTRGLKVTEITEKSLWLQGPQFLLFSNDNCTTDEQQHENVFLNSPEQKSHVTQRQPIDKDLRAVRAVVETQSRHHQN